MKKIFVLIFFLISTLMINAQDQKTFHDFTVKTLEGKDFDMSLLKGKKILVVNTASKCGYTPQYEDLQKLYEMYGGEKFEIIGFPANNFREQEPGTNAEIREFCTSNYGVTFPMMAKISVKGEDIHPIYQWLTRKGKNGVLDSEIKWNFQKYLIDEKGNLVEVLYSKEKPTSEKILSWINEE